MLLYEVAIIGRFKSQSGIDFQSCKIERLSGGDTKLHLPEANRFHGFVNRSYDLTDAV